MNCVKSWLINKEFHNNTFHEINYFFEFKKQFFMETNAWEIFPDKSFSSLTSWSIFCVLKKQDWKLPVYWQFPNSPISQSIPNPPPMNPFFARIPNEKRPQQRTTKMWNLEASLKQATLKIGPLKVLLKIEKMDKKLLQNW